MRRQRHLRPRRLLVDDELFRRRVQGATLRELAADYGVAHTTLGRHLGRPDARARLKEARIALRREGRELLAEVRRAEKERRKEGRERERERREAIRRVRGEIGRAAAAGERADGEPVHGDMSDARVGFRPRVDRGARSNAGNRAGRRRDPYLDWLDLRDRGRGLTRRERWSINDGRAAEAVAAGGGMEAVVRVTGLRSEANVRRGIDPDIVADARRNDAVRLQGGRSGI